MGLLQPSILTAFLHCFLPSCLPSLLPSSVPFFVPSFLRSLPSFLCSLLPWFPPSYPLFFLRSFVYSFLPSLPPSLPPSHRLRGKKGSGGAAEKKRDYFKVLTEKFESMTSSEKAKIRQDELDDMKAFIAKMAPVPTIVDPLSLLSFYRFVVVVIVVFLVSTSYGINSQ